MRKKVTCKAEGGGGRLQALTMGGWLGLAFRWKEFQRNISKDAEEQEQDQGKLKIIAPLHYA